MKTNYVLVDFENVQPNNLDALRVGPFKIKVFVGANQKISVDVAKALQAFGEDAEYIQIEGNGKNALDFHIAYYIGRLVVESPDAFFHIISKDTGFDPLIKHLKEQKIFSKRSSSVEDIPLIKNGPDSRLLNEQVETVMERLAKGTKPRSLKTLTSTTKGLFKQLSGEQMESIVKELQKREIITIADNDKISYGPQS